MLSLLSGAPSWAEGDAGDCGNGMQCPAGNACLMGGFCAVALEAAPGSVESKSVPGKYCEPGFRESTVQRGKCLPESYSECSNGLTCPSGMQCAPAGCIGGPPPSGPQ